MKFNLKILIPFLIIYSAIMLSPFFIFAKSTDFEVAVWVPYWHKTVASEEVKNNLKQLTTISPFSFEVDANGKIKDTLKIGVEPWPSLIHEARASKVKIIPTIMWSNGEAMDKIFRNAKLRSSHVAEIMKIVKAGNYDGIDIDYENKKAETYRGFTAFLRLLSLKLKAQNKTLVCTIEARMPPTSRFLVVPAKIEYANNYKAINKYCDEVRIMAYDQMTADILLTKRKIQLGYYSPVADKDWVKKVVAFSSNQIDREKLVLGVANYGYEYEVTDKGTYYDYKKIRSVSYKTATDLAKTLSKIPERNSAGELSFTYIKGPPSSKSGEASATRLVWFSDKKAIADKIALAKTMRLKGVALFRADGSAETGFWEEVFK